MITEYAIEQTPSAAIAMASAESADPTSTFPHFVHLRLHSEYSIVDGLVRIDDVVKAAANDKQPALAMTDLANLFGMVKFYKAARGKGIKPIVGCDVWITNDANRDNPSRLLLLVKNRLGYLQLCELLAQAWIENQHRGRAELKFEWLQAIFEQQKEPGLIALSGAHFGDIGCAIDNGNLDAAERNAQRWASIFPQHFYIEIQRAGQPNMENHVRQAVDLANRLGLPVMATHPIQFINKEDFTAHEARTCIAEGEMLANGRRVRRFNDQQCFKTQEEMLALFSDLPGALQNAVEIAKRCSLTLELGKPKLPDFPTPDGMTINEFLVAESKKGLEYRLTQVFPNEEKREQERARYEAQA